LRRSSLVVLVALCGCSGGTPFEGLAPAVDQGGPHVWFDLSHKPLPEIPFPNDLATRPDSSSPTGLRLNVSLIAPSQLERNMRALLDTLDGFGTYAAITVKFDAPLDVVDLSNRQNDADPSNDGVYLVDLTTGQTTPLDLNGGHFPYTLNIPDQYFPDDPSSNVFNLLFPVGAPCANCFQPNLPHVGARAQADDLITFYESETNTLVMRPALPLAQERKYAVVLTKRILGKNGKAISSPHSGINHTAQTGELKPLLDHLPPGTRLEDIAYTWAFTTQSTTREFERIRDGLYGRGPLANLADMYPVRDQITGTSSLMKVLQEQGAFDPANPSTNLADYRLPVAQLTRLLNDPFFKGLLISADPLETQALLDTFKYVDYFVSGQFDSPSFLNTITGEPADQSFRIDMADGVSRTQAERVTFILAVPKARPEVGHVPPFPVVIAGHGYKSTRIEHILGFAGTFAKFGLATIAIDAYGHGIGIDPTQEAAARAVARQYGLEAFADAVFRGRARDLDYDGIKDPGGDFWTAETFHTRDVVRQSIVDWMQLVRVLRTFDGVTGMVVAQRVARAGDFNGDGIPDVGGPVLWPRDVTDLKDSKKKIFLAGTPNPGGDLFVFGISLGGILSGILPAVEPGIVAAAPASGAGGLADVGIRSTLDQVVQAVFLEVLGPLLVTCPFSAMSGPVDAQTGLPAGACNAAASDAQPMLALVVQDVNRERDIPIAPRTLAQGDRVTLLNLAQTSADTDCSSGPKIDGCSSAVADGQGRVRVPISADWPSLRATRTPRKDLVDRVQVTVLRPGDPLRIKIVRAGGSSEVIDTFQVGARFFGVDYPVGAPLVSPARGYGVTRNTPEFRRQMGLSQLILDPGDPINYAPHYFNDLLGARATPANVLVIGTSGDPGVPVMTSVSLARAAGLVEMQTPDPAYGVPIDQVLIRSGAVEGVPGTRRFEDPDGGVYAALPGHVRCSGCTAGDVLIDPTSYACDAGVCSDRFDGGDPPRLDPPLQQQLVRVSAPQPAATYSTGASTCGAGPGVSALLIPYLNRTGQHGFRNPQPQKPFDMDQYLANLAGRYFECRGRELHFEPCQADLSSCPWIPPPPP